MEGKIYEAISNVMSDIGVVSKGDVNKTQGFKYRGIDAVMNALNPAMVKHKVFCVPEVLEQNREERQTQKGGTLIYSICRIKYRFYTSDGSYVETTTVGEGMDSGDKATNKAMAIAFKYACFQVFCIPTEEMKDPDEESHEVKGSKKRMQNTRSEAVMSDSSIKDVQGEACPNPDKKISQELISALEAEIKRTGIADNVILDLFKVKEFGEMSEVQYTAAMNRFKKTPTKGK